MVESTVLIWIFESADGRNISYHLASEWLIYGQLCCKYRARTLVPILGLSLVQYTFHSLFHSCSNSLFISLL